MVSLMVKTTVSKVTTNWSTPPTIRQPQPKRRTAATSKRVATGAALTMTMGVASVLALVHQEAAVAATTTLTPSTPSIETTVDTDPTMGDATALDTLEVDTTVALAPRIVVIRRVHHVFGVAPVIETPRPPASVKRYAPRSATKSAPPAFKAKQRQRIVRARVAKRVAKPRVVRTKAS
jgi:hypothetical protein